MKKERIKTLAATSLSGLLGGFLYFLIPSIPVLFFSAPIVFGLGVLASNHEHIKWKRKLIPYLLIGPIALIVQSYGGIIFAGVGANLFVRTVEKLSFLAVYFGSGLCALFMAYIFERILDNINLTLLNCLIIFLLGSLSLLIFFLTKGFPLDNLYQGIPGEDIYGVLPLIWQPLVGVGIALSLKRKSTPNTAHEQSFG
ncbi:hypothetical protein ACFSRY_12775 [Pontibacter locisalis]|uniref:DUF4203 domain-containing protein n=1 Tax=Pontibacter locisalis TaxID=1719035 RepID=A0ABW5IMF9_9BACT